MFSLLAPGADPHLFNPGARDVAQVADADLVISNGLGLEAGWLSELLHNASSEDAHLVELGESVNPLPSEDDHDEDEDEHEHDEDEDEHEHDEDEDEHEHDEDEDEHEHDEHDEDEDAHDAHDHHGHAHGAEDPHFWFDPIRVKVAVAEIAEHLSELDPAGADVYEANARAYNAELDELHAWSEQQLAQIPHERRLLVTSHDSFRYFAELYDFEIVGTVIPGLTTEREPSAQEIAELIDHIRELGVPAIFAETTVSENLVLRIADETGTRIGTLNTGSLGNTGSYIEMVQANVGVMVEALR